LRYNADSNFSTVIALYNIWSSKKEEKYPKSASLHQSFCLIAMATEQQILSQSDNGAEITVSIISQLKDLWPECKVVHGKPRHPQNQGSVELVNADIKDMP
jgi:hypothetical protein